MSYEVYFEAQDVGSALCGQHAINNLLQGSYFTAIDLGHIGSRLDEQEQNLLFSIDEDEKLSEEQISYNNTSVNNNSKQRKYSNVSMEGLFSVDVLITALKQLNIDALPLNHPDCSTANEHPDQEQGFIFYQMSHWIAYRKINDVWYDLNSQSNYISIEPQPVRITEFFLSAQISKLQDEGFQVYVIRGKLPTLARYAPKTNDLEGEFSWYQSADIESHVDLVKESQRKQEEEQRVKTRQLMINDPQQYNALMGNNNYNTYDSFPVEDPYGMNIPPEHQMYHQQQQWLAMERYKQSQNNNKPSDSNNNTSDNTNGIMAKISNPFSKLKKIYNEKTKEIKTKINGGNDINNNNMSTNTGNAQQYLDDLERAKQESLKIAQKQNNNNSTVTTKKYNEDFSSLNTVGVESYGIPDNHLNYGQTQHRVTYNTNNNNNNNNVNSNPYGQNVVVVSQPPTNKPQLNTKSTDDDIQLAMALSASIAENNNNDSKNNDEYKLPPPQKENVDLEFEMTDHKPKIIRKQPQPQQEDFLDLMSMNNNNKPEEKDVTLDENDPFSSLIKQYSNENRNGNANGNDFDLLDFGTNNNNNNNNNSNNKEQVEFENNLFGDNTSNDFMTLIGDGKGKNESNPLISPNNNNNNNGGGGGSGDSMGFKYNDPVKTMEDDLWRMLENQLTDNNM